MIPREREWNGAGIIFGDSARAAFPPSEFGLSRCRVCPEEGGWCWTNSPSLPQRSWPIDEAAENAGVDLHDPLDVADDREQLALGVVLADPQDRRFPGLGDDHHLEG